MPLSCHTRTLTAFQQVAWQATKCVLFLFLSSWGYIKRNGVFGIYAHRAVDKRQLSSIFCESIQSSQDWFWVSFVRRLSIRFATRDSLSFGSKKSECGSCIYRYFRDYKLACNVCICSPKCIEFVLVIYLAAYSGIRTHWLSGPFRTLFKGTPICIRFLPAYAMHQ